MWDHAGATTDPDTQASLARHLTCLASEIADRTAQRTALAAADPVVRWPRTIRGSGPGIGVVTAQLLLAALRDLGTRDPKTRAALVGVAPFRQPRGAADGTAHIDGGRRQVRTGLWMPPLTAITPHPVLRIFTARLAAAHQPPKVVTIACMRTLRTILTAMLAKDDRWPPRLPQA